MKSFLKWTGLVLLAVVIGLALAFAFTSWSGFDRVAPGDNPIPPRSQWSPDYGWKGNGQWKGRGGWGMGPGMMGGFGFGNRPFEGGTPLTLDQAVEAAGQYLANYGNPDLALTEVMAFENNFYAEVEEQSTGIHAFELLIDRFSGAVYPEPGPNMMWNTRYGHMGRMMGGWANRSVEPMSVSGEQALALAQQWLDQNLPGSTVADEADTFYGYYTIHVLKDGQIYGMLSVNGYSGDVWYHNWHGKYLDMIELEK